MGGIRKPATEVAGYLQLSLRDMRTTTYVSKLSPTMTGARNDNGPSDRYCEIREATWTFRSRSQRTFILQVSDTRSFSVRYALALIASGVRLR